MYNKLSALYIYSLLFLVSLRQLDLRSKVYLNSSDSCKAALVFEREPFQQRSFAGNFFLSLPLLYFYNATAIKFGII